MRSADGLRIMTYEDLDGLSRNVMRNNPPAGTYFSIISVKLLKAFEYWLHLQDRLGSVDEDYAAPAADPAVPNPRGGNAGKNQFGHNAHGCCHAGH